MNRQPRTQSLSICVGTWNVNTINPEKEAYKLQYDISNWLMLGQNAYDIIVVGLQECQMDVESFLAETTSMKEKWIETLNQVFIMSQDVIHKKQKRQSLSQNLSEPKKSNFKLVDSVQLVGILICVYVLDKHWKQMSEVSTHVQREGVLKGTFGNKGGAGIRFRLYKRDFLFINCHLSAHMKNVEQRNSNLNNILSKSQFKINNATESVSVDDHDFIFLLGDFNYRIQQILSDPKTVLGKIKKEEWEFLQLYDQCRTERRRGTILANYEEGALTFAPTYKYKKGSDEWASKRVPSWTDRIFWKSKDMKSVDLNHYGRSSSFFSDHKPVRAWFTVRNVPLIRSLPPLPPQISNQSQPKRQTLPYNGDVNALRTTRDTRKLPRVVHSLPQAIQPINIDQPTNYQQPKNVHPSTKIHPVDSKGEVQAVAQRDQKEVRPQVLEDPFDVPIVATDELPEPMKPEFKRPPPLPKTRKPRRSVRSYSLPPQSPVHETQKKPSQPNNKEKANDSDLLNFHD